MPCPEQHQPTNQPTNQETNKQPTNQPTTKLRSDFGSRFGKHGFQRLTSRWLYHSFCNGAVCFVFCWRRRWQGSSWGFETESVFCLGCDPAAQACVCVCGSAFCWWLFRALLLRCLPRSSPSFSSLWLLRCFLSVVALPLRGFARGAFSLWESSLSPLGQSLFGTLIVIRGFFNDGMFFLKMFCQAVASEFVQLVFFGFMTKTMSSCLYLRVPRLSGL